MDRARKIQALQIGVGAGIAVVAVVLLLLLSNVGIQTPPHPTGKTPPTVSTANATGVGPSAATLNGNLASLGSASSTTVGFTYWAASSVGGATNVTVGSEAAATSFSESLSGLTAGTAYYFEAWALGDGFVQGSALGFKTTTSVSQKTPPSVATKAASAVGMTNATLNGDLSALGTANAVTVGFLYGTSPDLSAATNVTVGSQTATGAFSEFVAGLLPNKTYYVQAWAMGDGFTAGSIVAFVSAAAGNGNIVPPGWAHAACPDLPSQAVAYGVRARCEFNMTWGEMKKLNLTGELSPSAPANPHASAQAQAAASKTHGNAPDAATDAKAPSGRANGNPH